MKLFRSRKSPHRWYAHSAATGWVTFPVQSEGWAKRTPARGIDPIDIREVPLHLAYDCGIPGCPNSALGDAA